MNDNMNNEMIRMQAVRFKRARGNLLLVVILTAANLLLIQFDVGWGFFFTAFVPEMIMIILQESFAVMGLFVALLFTSVYLLCYVVSKHKRGAIVFAMVLFVIDALVMFALLVASGAIAASLFNIAFHAWILFYLITGSVAWAKLKDVDPDEVRAVQQEVEQRAQEKELDSALRDIMPDEDEEEDDDE